MTSGLSTLEDVIAAAVPGNKLGFSSFVSDHDSGDYLDAVSACDASAANSRWSTTAYDWLAPAAAYVKTGIALALTGLAIGAKEWVLPGPLHGWVQASIKAVGIDTAGLSAPLLVLALGGPIIGAVCLVWAMLAIGMLMGHLDEKREQELFGEQNG